MEGDKVKAIFLIETWNGQFIVQRVFRKNEKVACLEPPYRMIGANEIVNHKMMGMVQRFVPEHLMSRVTFQGARTTGPLFSNADHVFKVLLPLIFSKQDLVQASIQNCLRNAYASDDSVFCRYELIDKQDLELAVWFDTPEFPVEEGEESGRSFSNHG